MSEKRKSMFLRNERGATAIEYGLIAALIGVAIIGGANAVGKGVNDTFTDAAGKMNSASSGTTGGETTGGTTGGTTAP